MSLPGGIRTRIVLVLVGIVAGALGTAYMIVVPSLERRLVDARLEQLAKLGVPLAKTLPEDTLLWQDRVESFGVETNSRVVAFSVLSKTQSSLVVVADSRTRSSRDVQTRPDRPRGDDVGGRRAGPRRRLEAAGTRRWRRRRGPRRCCSSRSRSPIRSRRSRSFASACSSPRRSRSSSRSSSGSRLRECWRTGFSGSRSAAERIAGGDFDAPIVDHGNDEIGELARAFDRMRVQLAQLDNARKEFVANASHELRTPLFSIGGFLELLADEELDEETRRGFIETMQGQVQRLAKLSTDLLDLSRVDAGQLTVVREAGRSRRRRPDARRRARASRRRRPATIFGRRSRTMSGASETTHESSRSAVRSRRTHSPTRRPGTRVTIRARRRGDRAELVVEDDGPGIPTAQRDAVFSRFYRVEGGMASGSGLGLAIAREIARVMGGEVRLDSEARPTVFALDLPGEPVPPDAPRTPAAFSRENASPEPESVTQGS